MYAITEVGSCLLANVFLLVIIVICAHASKVAKSHVKTECAEAEDALDRFV